MQCDKDAEGSAPCLAPRNPLPFPQDRDQEGQTRRRGEGKAAWRIISLIVIITLVLVNIITLGSQPCLAGSWLLAPLAAAWRGGSINTHYTPVPREAAGRSSYSGHAAQWWQQTLLWIRTITGTRARTCAHTHSHSLFPGSSLTTAHHCSPRRGLPAQQ